MSRKKKKEFKELPVGAEAVDGIEYEYQRSRWKHFFRWFMLGVVMMFYLMLFLLSYRAHVLQHKGFLLQELLGYLLCTIMVAPVIPSVVLEVDYVRTGLEEILFRNLLWARRERWQDIVKLIDPRFLKFAVVRTRTFVYLLNRRDLPHFDELMETIKDRAINLKK